MAAQAWTPFMEGLVDTIVKERGTQEATAHKYVREAQSLNGGSPFASLKFLLDHEQVMEVLARYTNSTRRSKLGGILTLLKVAPPKGGTKQRTQRARQVYEDTVQKLRKEMDENTNTLTDTQRGSWMDWREVVRRRDRLVRDAMKPGASHRVLLRAVVVGLYTYQPPRRNEYSRMLVVDNQADATDNTNYLVTGGPMQFIFRRYKTSKEFGEQLIKVAAPLERLLRVYLDRHPLKQQDAHPFLVEQNGQPVAASNGITLLLNEALGKGISSTMLRHIFLTEKLGDVLATRRRLAHAMAHSIEMQTDYIVDTEQETT